MSILIPWKDENSEGGADKEKIRKEKQKKKVRG